MEGMSTMWADLKQNGSLPEKSVLLSNCEAELQELMRQIDIMVQSKKVAWDHERQALQARLDIREQEHTLHKASLEQKHAEIGKLRQQLGDMESSQVSLVSQYENQLAKMKTEVGGMKREYEKLKKLHNKHVTREKHKTSTEMEDSLTDIKRLNGKLEDYRMKSREWEQQKRAYIKQIDALDSQKRTLEEKCNLIQQQTVGYQSQLDRRRDLLDSTEISLRSQITQLEGQLERARDTVNSQDTQIARLRQTVDESVESQRKALEEKEHYEREVRQAQSKLRHLEGDFAQYQHELEAKAEKLKQSEAVQQRISRECHQMEKVLAEKEACIQSLRKVDSGHHQHKTQSLEEDLKATRDELRKYRKQDKHMKEELSNHQHQLEESQEQCRRLSEELAQKLQDKLAMVEESHAAKEQGMKAELATLTSDLHQRNVAMAALSEKAASMERQLRETNETLDRKSAEVQVTQGQLDALRLENRHLRKVSLRSSTGDLDPVEAEGQLQELQNAYVTSLSALEEQNKSLKADLSSNRHRVRELENHLQGASSDLDNSRSSQPGKDRKGSVHKGDKVGGNHVSQLEEDVYRLKQQLQLRDEDMNRLENQLARQINTIKKLGLENEVMTHFVDDLDDVIQKPPRRDGSARLDSSGHFSHISSLENTMLSDDEDGLDPVDTVTAQFLAEQEERTKELERKLDSHIESLKVSTDATLRKYST